MLNSFRQLTRIWLAAVVVMALFTGCWHYYDGLTQQRLQLEQFASTVQLSVVPLLKDRDQALVQAQLNHMRYVSALPITAMAVFDGQHRVLAAADTIDVLRPFIPKTAVTSFSMQQQGLQIIVQQPLAESTSSQPQLRAERPGSYLLLSVQQDIAYSSWLLPLLVVLLIGLMVLKALQHSLQQAASRLHTDISLLTHKLSQLRQGQLNIRVDEDLVPELEPLKQALNDAAQQQTSALQRTKAELLQLELKWQQEAASYQGLQQQCDELLHERQRLQQVIQLRLANLRQLSQHSTDMDAEQLQSALNSITNLLFLEQHSVDADIRPVRLTELVATVVTSMQQPLAAQGIDLHVIETDGLAVHQLDVAEPQLRMLLVALLQVAARVSAATELVLRMRLSRDEQPVLDISVTCNGNGVPARVVQLINNADIRSLQWHEADIGCIISVRQQCAASMSVQSLEGLGSTLNVQLPVKLTEVPCRQFQHLLLFDNSLLLSERIRSLNSLAQNVVSCTDINELQRKAAQYHYDLMLFLLPEPAELQQWQQALSQCNTQTPSVFYARASEQQVWRETLKRPVESLPFCLQHLNHIAIPSALPRLLVVDDNPTNLAFVKVLLQSQPLHLTMAASGAEALQFCLQQRFDIILLDIQLPDIAGTEVAKQLRQRPDYHSTPILAFTAHALDEEILAFKRAGMNDVILKPLDASKLEQILYWCSIIKTDDIGE